MSYLRYCLDESPKKLLADTDQEPWSWPPIAPAALIEFIKQPSPQIDAHSGDTSGVGRKRKLMTFSEVTDAFVEANVQTDQDALVLAKSRKVTGDPTLFNTLGATPCVGTLVTRVHKAWACESLASGTLCKQPDYALDKFVAVNTVHERLAAWVAGDWKEQSLMLNGAGGLGKTDGGIYVAKFVSYTQVYETLS